VIPLFGVTVAIWASFASFQNAGNFILNSSRLAAASGQSCWRAIEWSQANRSQSLISIFEDRRLHKSALFPRLFCINE
jgi:hypothetical protein